MQQTDLDSYRNLAQKIAKWKARLADTGRRNPLIKFRQDNLRSLEILTPEPDILFNHLTEKKKTLYFQSISNSQVIVPSKQANATKNGIELGTRQTDNEQLKRLKKLCSIARLSLEERGVNSLFLAFGTLTWYDKDKPDEALVSPLILAPVKLVKVPKRDVYNISILEEDVVLNPTLSLKLKQTFGIEFPEEEAIQDITYEELIIQIRQLLAEQETWEIQENVFLSLFSYAKAAMVRDLIENEDRIFAHPILQAIGGDLTAYQARHQEPPSAFVLDSQIPPEKTFQILDADSSQQVVIEAAKSGSSFLVQGPPGTGKSQTIVNMISELISDGKSVLLVAEKDTALRVVYQRMVECGLNHVCLNLHHSGTTDKRKFVEDLSKTIQYIEHLTQNSEEERHDNFFSQLTSTRQSLSSYLVGLHTKEQPLGKSPFELFGELLQMEREGVPDLDVIFTNFNQWTPDKLQEAKKLLDKLSGFLPFLKEEKTTIWAKSSLESYSYDVELELKEKIKDFQAVIQSIHKVTKKLENILQVQELSNVQALQAYAPALSHLEKLPFKLPENWTNTSISKMQATLEILKSDVQIIEQGTRCQPEVFSQEFRDLCERFQKYSDFAPFRFFEFGYDSDVAKIKALCNIRSSISYSKLKQGTSQALKIQSIKDQLRRTDYLPYQVFGSLLNPNISKTEDLKPIGDAIKWLTDLQQYLPLLPNSLINSIVNDVSERQKVFELITKFKSSYSSISEKLKDFLLCYFNENDITDKYLPFSCISFTDLDNFLSQMQDELPDLQSWLDYKQTCNDIDDLGTKKFLSALRESKINPKYWFPALEKLIYKTYLEAIFTQKSELRNFNFEVHERQIREFINLDFSQLDIARERLKQIHAECWLSWQETSTAKSELPKLKKEVNKKRQHLPIRQLLNDKQRGIRNLTRILKPCWMMSPLSVSQYIDANLIHFDVLIFDEASQLRTEDVVSAIIRSDQVIVIGDQKQLPPTSFFSTGDVEDEDDENDESYESILDECSNFMSKYTLKWHYRSQDERLITFSNLNFYDSQLVTFPNPIQNPDLGVWFKHVPNGIYDRGGRRDNRNEAAIVAQLVLEHIQQASNQSLGIIAFSEAQADAIQEQIEILGKKYPKLEAFCRDNSPQFFLKALENVQGDERDVILLSVGYARDAQGKLSLNFGPLNKKGGERRLNVAVTRAKNKITLVSSILAGDIDSTRTESKGVKLLRDYLDYAVSGGERLQGNFYSEKLDFGSPFEEDVYYTLIQHPLLQNYKILTQVGCSGYRIDLAIAHNDHPGEFLLGIECDGATYHRSPTARDRDRLRQEVLERLGWRIHRIWSTEWFRNKSEQVRLLIERINQL